MPDQVSRYVDDQVIAAEGEQKASRALKEAAAVINESPSALQVVLVCLFVFFLFVCCLVGLLVDLLIFSLIQHTVNY